jgi:hypothetical protein
MTVGMCVNAMGPLGTIGRVDDAEAFGAVDAFRHVGDGAVVGPWAHRAGPAHVGEGVTLGADHVR